METAFDIFKANWPAALAICFSLLRTWQLKRQIKWLKRLSELEQQRRIYEANETWKTAATAFASAEPITLDDLLNKREADFSLKSSGK